MKKDKEQKGDNKKEKSPLHFLKRIRYSKSESWRTDFLFGQRESKSHGHIALSGTIKFYLRDEQGREIVLNGDIISNNTPPNYRQIINLTL